MEEQFHFISLDLLLRVSFGDLPPAPFCFVVSFLSLSSGMLNCETKQAYMFTVEMTDVHGQIRQGRGKIEREIARPFPSLWFLLEQWPSLTFFF